MRALWIEDFSPLNPPVLHNKGLTKALGHVFYELLYYVVMLKLFYAAIANLSGVSLYGKKIHVTHSKHGQVQMPQAGSNVNLLLIIHSAVILPGC